MNTRRPRVTRDALSVRASGPHRAAAPIPPLQWLICTVAGLRDGRPIQASLKVSDAPDDNSLPTPYWAEANRHRYLEATGTELLALNEQKDPLVRDLQVVERRMAEEHDAVTAAQDALRSHDALPAPTLDTIKPGPGEQGATEQVLLARRLGVRAAGRAALTATLDRKVQELNRSATEAAELRITVSLLLERCRVRCDRQRSWYTRRLAWWARAIVWRTGGNRRVAQALESVVGLPAIAISEPLAETVKESR